MIGSLASSTNASLVAKIGTRGKTGGSDKTL